ncbi:MAG: adenine deaminase [Saprospiraceae bacterium]|nr:adenine deaminase [Saprospiraceae bacterium]
MRTEEFELKANIVDLHKRSIYPAIISVKGDRIASVQPIESTEALPYVLPGFVDAHIHIESSMLPPAEFARIALTHGTVATVSDPHEIANVLGVEGVRFMLEDAAKSPLHFCFGAPSCVPATSFETAGAEILADEIAYMFDELGLTYLSEVMNYPGVLFNDPIVIAKLQEAKKRNLPIDGHAPGLKGEKAAQYAAAGISTDHECFTMEEALDKIAAGMKIIIREGSAAKNYPALHGLIGKYPDKVMFCSDDKHPDDLILGHINKLVKRALKDGYELMDILNIACKNPVEHYRLPIGLLREGEYADFIAVDNFADFTITDVWIKGKQIVQSGRTEIEYQATSTPNVFVKNEVKESDIQISQTKEFLRVIEAINGELITGLKIMKGKVQDGFWVQDTEQDILKIVVVNRYNQAAPAVGFINGFGLNYGAIASSVAHDCHNIIAVGANDEAICAAIEVIQQNQGGVSVVDENGIADILPLPIAGIMSHLKAEDVAAAYQRLDQTAKELGSKLSAPYMSLSFMGLLVIPALKMSDLGLFDGAAFQFVEVECD